MATPTTTTRRPESRPARPRPPQPPGPPPERARRSLLWRWRRPLFVLSLLGFSAVAASLYLLAQVPLPKERPTEQTTFFLDAGGGRLASIDAGENRVSVRLRDVPQVLTEAVLAAEDRKFYDHSGIDPVGIARALVHDLRGTGVLQGGSTITQQYVKNSYLTSERTIVRKLKEASIAIKVERKLDKDEILERYLNTIYFGRGAYGVQAASRAYFGKDVGELGLPEASYLAGLIRAPELADAERDPKTATARRSRTLAAMRRAGFITAAEQAEVERTPITDYVIARAQQEPVVVGAGEIGTEYFVELVRQQLVRRYGEGVLNRGLRVTTTLDMELQRQAYEAVYGLLDRPDDPAGALVAVDEQGRVRAMVGGRGYGQGDPAIARVNLAAGREGGGSGRQPGSTFKPFLLAAMVRDGYTLESSFPAPDKVEFPHIRVKGKPWIVRNYENEYFDGSMNMIDATAKSVNTVYAQAVDALGYERVIEAANELGIATRIDPADVGPSIVLGTKEVSVLEMASAYSTLARRGERIEPHVISSVTLGDGTPLPWDAPERARVLGQGQADAVTFSLRQAVERGTGTGARLGRQAVAGKTGTTQDYGDAWFVGYTPKLTTAVWMGFPEGNSKKMTSVRGRKVSGGSFPATIFKRFMTDAVRQPEYAGGSFPAPRGFRGKVLKGGDRVKFATTTTSTSTTSTTVPETTTTTAATTATTTAPGPSTTTTSTPPSTTTTTAPPGTTTTTRRSPVPNSP